MIRRLLFWLFLIALACLIQYGCSGALAQNPQRCRFAMSRSMVEV